MRKSTVMIAGAVVLLLLGGLWYWGSPAYAMSGLRDAAIEGDADDLEERIDFAAVRVSLKEQMRAHLAAEMVKSDDGDGFAAFGSVLAMGMVDPLIDGLVTPQSMSAMIERGKVQDDDAAVESDNPIDWKIERDGFSRFEARPETGEGGPAPTLVFERDGLGWRLVEIEIPEGGLGDAA